MGHYRKSAVMPGQILYAENGASMEDYEEFIKRAHQLPLRQSRYWVHQCLYKAEARLAQNMTIITERMKRKSVTTVIPDGVTEHELQMLAVLDRFPQNLRIVGHELLNLRERQLFADTFRVIFNAYRCKGEVDGEQECAGA